jgi:hypothetical protein
MEVFFLTKYGRRTALALRRGEQTKFGYRNQPQLKRPTETQKKKKGLNY